MTAHLTGPRHPRRRNLGDDGGGGMAGPAGGAMSGASGDTNQVEADPYCPEHGSLPTTYDECSCEMRAWVLAVERPCGCDRPDMKPDHPRMAGCSLYSCHDISVCVPMYGPEGCGSTCCHLKERP